MKIAIKPLRSHDFVPAKLQLVRGEVQALAKILNALMQEGGQEVELEPWEHIQIRDVLRQCEEFLSRPR